MASLWPKAIFRLSAQYRSALIVSHRPSIRVSTQLTHARCLTLPRILQPTFWAAVIPTFLRRDPSRHKFKGWNPATSYILLGLLVGSQAIRNLSLKQERGLNLRRAEAKIGVLREVIERVQKGEDVNVEQVLGTGDEESEKEWAEILKKIEDDAPLFQGKRDRNAKKQLTAEGKNSSSSEKQSRDETDVEPGKVKVESIAGAKFY